MRRIYALEKGQIFDCNAPARDGDDMAITWHNISAHYARPNRTEKARISLYWSLYLFSNKRLFIFIFHSIYMRCISAACFWVFFSKFIKFIINKYYDNQIGILSLL